MSVTILDGGMGQELISRSDRDPTGLWATQVMIDAPEIVRAVHDDYFAAGAEIATANTYAIHRDRLAPRGLESQFEALQVQACRLAVAARDAHGAGRVAGALGPLMTSYRPDLAPPAEDAARLYSEIVAVQRPYVDLYIAETMSSVDQARGALLGALPAGKPVWLGLSVDDADGTILRSGEPLASVLPLLAELAPAAVLINCSTPEAVCQALPVIARAGLPFGAYANGFTRISDEFREPGTTVDLLDVRQDLSPHRYAEFAVEWVGLGASIVGGCCEVGPAHISMLAERLKG